MTKEEVIWIETFTRRRVDPLHMLEDDIDIRDIYISLSHLCRYVGQCKRFYSVGQHSIHVAEMVLNAPHGDRPREEHHRTCLAALLHDGAEAYISDISRPVKHSIAQLMKVEDRLMGEVTKRFKLHGADWSLIKKMDNIMLATEAFELMQSRGEGWYLPEPRDRHLVIPVMTSTEVQDVFIDRFHMFGGEE